MSQHRSRAPFAIVAFAVSIVCLNADCFAQQAPAAPSGDRDAASAVRAFLFRGIEPGVTSESTVSASKKWGQPKKRTRQADGSELLEFQLRGYKKVDVLIRRGIVQSIDVTMPDGVDPAFVAEAFELGKPVDEKLPEAAAIGTTTPETWIGKRYTAGRVILFVETSDGKPVVRLLRVYANRTIPAAAKETTPTTALNLRGQGETSRQIVRSVVSLLPKHHYSQRKLDDQIAEQWMENFIEQLDPGKLHFLQSDIDRFRKMSESIDDRAKLGDVEFAYDVFKIYIERRSESFPIARQFLAAEHDFTVDEELIQGKDAPYPENRIEAREIWRKRVKYEILSRKVNGASDAESRQKVSRHFDDQFRLPDRIDDDQLLEWCLAALGRAFDPHSNFYSPRTLEDFQIGQRLQMVGIGAALKKVDGDIVVTSLVAGSPSALDGRLNAGDRIIAVGLSDDDLKSVTDMSLSDAVRLIRGESGTSVHLRVLPKGQQQTRNYKLVRAKIQLGSTVTSRTLQAGSDADGGPFTMLVITVPALYSNEQDTSAHSSTKDVANVLKRVKSENVDAVVLDMRNNGGGSLPEAIRFAGLFLEPGPILRVKDQSGRVEVYNTSRAPETWDGPLVVMTSKGTASGAEIICGAIQAASRGLLIGDRSTYGNGSIQNLIDIGAELVKGDDPPKLGALRVTTNLHFLPNGLSVQMKGIDPDIVLPSYSQHLAIGDRLSAGALPAQRINPNVYRKYRYVNNQLVTELRKQSTTRRAAAADFQEYLKLVQAYADRQSQQTTLNEEEFRKRYPVQRDEDDNVGGNSAEPYLDEVLAIAADYLSRSRWFSQHIASLRQIQNREYSAAIASLSKAIQSDPQRLAAYEARARAYAARGDWEEAFADLKKTKEAKLRCATTAAAALAVENKTVANLQEGDELVVSDLSGKWLWGTSQGKTGWIDKKFVRPMIGTAPATP